MVPASIIDGPLSDATIRGDPVEWRRSATAEVCHRDLGAAWRNEGVSRLRVAVADVMLRAQEGEAGCNLIWVRIAKALATRQR